MDGRAVPSFMIGPSTAITQIEPKASVGKSGPPPRSIVAMVRAASGSISADGEGRHAGR